MSDACFVCRKHGHQAQFCPTKMQVPELAAGLAAVSDQPATAVLQVTGAGWQPGAEEGFVQVKRKAPEPHGSRQNLDPRPLYPIMTNPFEALMDEDNQLQVTSVPLPSPAPDQTRDHLNKEVHTPRKHAIARDCADPTQVTAVLTTIKQPGQTINQVPQPPAPQSLRVNHTR